MIPCAMHSRIVASTYDHYSTSESQEEGLINSLNNFSHSADSFDCSLLSSICPSITGNSILDGFRATKRSNAISSILLLMLLSYELEATMSTREHGLFVNRLTIVCAGVSAWNVDEGELALLSQDSAAGNIQFEHVLLHSEQLHCRYQHLTPGQKL